MAMMVKMSTAWALSLLVLALSGCSATCRHDGRFWDGCNWCFCRDHYLVGCTNMACLSLPREVFQIDPNRPTIGPPQREGLFAYKPGRGVVVDPSGWPCQMGSSWLESGGCVRCNCINKMIKCRDSGMCLNGQPVSNELMPPQTEYVRRRRDNAPAAATPSPAAPVAEPAVEPTAATGTAATESTTSTAWAATEPAVTGGAESTVAPAEGAGQATPAAEAANATRAPPPATTTAQNTVVKDRSCRSGSTWEEDCNSCWCLDNGRAACTTNSCEPPPPLTLGAPGSPAATAGGIAAGPGVHGAAPGAAPAVALSAAVVPAVAAPAPGVPPAAAPAAVEATVPSSTPSSAAVTAAVPEASGAGSAAGSRRKRRVVLVSA